MRSPWTEEETQAVMLDWASFHALFPERSYAAWEVKRRRVPGGTAGSQSRRHIPSEDCWCHPKLLHIEVQHGF